MGVFESRPETVLRGLPSNKNIEVLVRNDGISVEDATAVKALYYLNDQLNLIKGVMSDSGRRAEYSLIYAFLEGRYEALSAQTRHIVWGEERVMREVRASRRAQGLD